MQGKKHKKSCGQPVQQNIVQLFNRMDGLDGVTLNIVKAFVESGIPLSKINSPPMKYLFETILKKKNLRS